MKYSQKHIAHLIERSEAIREVYASVDPVTKEKTLLHPPPPGEVYCYKTPQKNKETGKFDVLILTTKPLFKENKVTKQILEHNMITAAKKTGKKKKC